MILTSREILDRDLVHSRTPAGDRATTYDATVGEIIFQGTTFAGAAYVLPSRGMVWFVSHERFALHADITGLATLKTTWTHNGILALNVGIIDPGWDGPLATALVNFGNTNFEIKKGDPFLRVLFNQHLKTDARPQEKNTNLYLNEIREKSARIPSTFLDLEKLAQEMQSSLYGSPVFASWLTRIGLYVGVMATIIAICAIFIPIAYGVSTEYNSRRTDVEVLKASLEKLQKQQEDQGDKRIINDELKPALYLLQKQQDDIRKRQQELEDKYRAQRQNPP